MTEHVYAGVECVIQTYMPYSTNTLMLRRALYPNMYLDFNWTDIISS